jgi:hypothetical protein
LLKFATSALVREWEEPLATRSCTFAIYVEFTFRRKLGKQSTPGNQSKKMKDDFLKTMSKTIVRVTSRIFLLSILSFLAGCQGVSTGVGGSQPQPGSLSLPNGTLNFGTVTPGVSKTLTITAVNSGTAAVTISNASISSKYFALMGPSLPASVAAGQSAILSVQFTPNAAGSFSAVATLTNDGSTPTLSLSLAGTGASSAGQLSVSPASMGVGSVVVGASRTASGSLSASGADVTVTAADTNNSAFSVSGLSLPLTIPAGQSIPFTVTFSPQASGAASGTLTFNSSAQPSTNTEALTGNGMPAPTYSVNLSWNASTSTNISGYNVYRALYGGSCGSFGKINAVLNTSTLYTDNVVVDGKSYCYATTAVNTSSQESGYSNVVSNIQIPAP